MPVQIDIEAVPEERHLRHLYRRMAPLLLCAAPCFLSLRPWCSEEIVDDEGELRQLFWSKR